jgi:hypothetical protein
MKARKPRNSANHSGIGRKGDRAAPDKREHSYRLLVSPLLVVADHADDHSEVGRLVI